MPNIRVSECFVEDQSVASAYDHKQIVQSKSYKPLRYSYIYIYGDGDREIGGRTERDVERDEERPESISSRCPMSDIFNVPIENCVTEYWGGG